MPTNSDYFSLPVMDTGGGAWDTSSYNNTGSSFVADSGSTSSIWSTAGSTVADWSSDLWGWANTETGSNIIGGAISGAAAMYSQGLQQDQDESMADKQMAMQMEMQEKNLALEREKMAIAENRINSHNKSINNSDVKVKPRTFTK